MPPALTTTSARISRPLAAVLDGHAGDAAAVRADRRRPAFAAGSGRPVPARPAASALARPDGSSQPSVGRNRRAEHAVGRHQREAVAAPRPARSARAAARTSWPSRPGGGAPRAVPGSTPGGASRPRATPGRRPVSAASRRYSSAPYIIILVSVTEPRSWPTRPAEWNVEPEVSSARSTRTTSRPAALGQVVGDRRPADAAADDDRAGVLDHVWLVLPSVRSDRPRQRSGCATLRVRRGRCHRRSSRSSRRSRTGPGGR